MIDLGTVRPGSTIRIPFSTFDKDDGSSITMTNYATADFLVYKDGSTTERASTNGFTATTDFDSKTGKHLCIIDLADNTTAGFWAAGSEYVVALDAVTVDAVTTGGWIARFYIGYPDAWLNTTIATLASQTSFTLTLGPAEDDALNGLYCIIHDVASGVQSGWAVVLDYTGSTKTVTLAAGVTFTAAATDNISIMGPAPLQATVVGRTFDVSSTGEGGVDWANVGSPTTTVGLTNTTVGIVTLLNGLAANVITAAATAADFGTEVAAAVWDRLTSALTTGGSIGKLLVDDIDATVSSRASQTSLNTVDDFVDTEIADIQARLPAALTANGNIKADALRVGGTVQTGGDLAALITVVDDFIDTEVAAILAAVDTEVAAVKAITDQFVFTVANQVDSNVITKTGFRLSATGVDDVWDEATAGHTTAGTYGDKFGAHIAAVLKLVVDAGSTTTAVVFKTVDGAAASATDDFYNGRVIIFTSGALAGQATSISDYTGATKIATVVATTGGPADNVTGVIV